MNKVKREKYFDETTSRRVTVICHDCTSLRYKCAKNYSSKVTKLHCIALIPPTSVARLTSCFTLSSGDKHDQWQSMEGLAAIAIHEGRHGRAVRYFQAAITTLAASGERNDKAQKRLVAKLTDALQRQLVTGRATAGVAAQATAGVAAQATAGVADTARNGAEFNMVTLANIMCRIADTYLVRC